MSVNIRDYVSNNHVESIGEIAKSQSAIIQALSIDNSKLQQELERKDNNWNELKEFLIDLQKLKGINQQGFSWGVCQECLDKIKELENNGSDE